MSEVEVSAEMEKFIEYIENMSVLELTNLVKALEDRLGVSAAAPVAVAAGPAAGGDAAAAAEEKTEFDVFSLLSDKKIALSKLFVLQLVLVLKTQKTSLKVLLRLLKKLLLKKKLKRSRRILRKLVQLLNLSNLSLVK